MASTGRKQPPWIPPKTWPDVELPRLKVYNSLTREKNEFRPLDPEGKRILWYVCGPTVYDHSHLGHARNYVSTDIIRRILRDYFGFDITFVMNITDIDDKIILRARQRHLLDQFIRDQGSNSHSPISEATASSVQAAFRQYLQKNLPLIPPETATADYSVQATKFYGRVLEGFALEGTANEPPGDKEAKLKVHLRTAQSAAEALQNPQEASDFFVSVEDILMPNLDSMYGSSIDSKDHAIFTKLTKFFEASFMDDMRKLNVLEPDVLTRVTEYMPQIVAYTERIMANGFAYKTPDGSVYFDIEAFEKAGHHYARLEPWNRNDRDLQADGEGSLSKATTGKRNENDFALWKSSKPGEPLWPLGSSGTEGRVGWHLECTAMAGEVLGRQIDIHSGGADLRFPHHDNELAQAEAYWSEDGARVQWINYFFHTGHLSIQGMKMSKSLKNFTTIKAALKEPEWSARRIRICFLLGDWKEGIEIGEDLMKTVVAWESRLNNFFLKSLDVAKNRERSLIQITANGTPSTGSNNDKLLAALQKAKDGVDAALCDSFNTPVAMRALSDLVTEFNMMKGLSDDTVLDVARWITRLVTIFGLDAEGDLRDPNRVAWSGIDIPLSAQPFVYPAAELRDAVRQLARAGNLNYSAIAKQADDTKVGKSTINESSKPYAQLLDNFQAQVKDLASKEASPKDFLNICDQLRDTHLWNLGIYLEDRDPPLPAMVRPVDKSLMEARAEQESTAAAKMHAKLKREADEVEKKRILAEKSKLSHLEMFKTPEYADWDENGIPTKEKDGSDVTKSKRKKLQKDWEKQKKIHEQWLASKGT